MRLLLSGGLGGEPLEVACVGGTPLPRAPPQLPFQLGELTLL